MSKFLAKLFYRKKIRRFENLTAALEKIGLGDYREATRLCNEAKPTEFLDDIALYYFVSGRLALDSYELEKADLYLSTAWNLGFRRSSLFVSLGLTRARLGRFSDAWELLQIASKLTPESNEEEHNIIKQLLELMDKITQGDGKRKIESLLKKAVKTYSGKDRLKESELKKAFENLIVRESDSVNEMEELIAVCGEYLRTIHNGTWVFGLEMEDHNILINGITYRIKHIITAIRSGQITPEDLRGVSISTALSRVFVDELGSVNI